jgi:hypothetical protein
MVINWEIIVLSFVIILNTWSCRVLNKRQALEEEKNEFHRQEWKNAEIYRQLTLDNISGHLFQIGKELKEKNDGSWFSCHQVSDEEEKND